MKNIKNVGIVGRNLGRNGKNWFSIEQNYINFMKDIFPKATIHLLRPEDKQDYKLIDFLLLPGGPDVDPLRYSQEFVYETGNVCRSYEYFDKVHLQKYIESGAIIFGICRGMQTLNVKFGGTLTQHIEEHQTGEYQHKMKIIKNIGKYRANTLIGVNSYHHQCIKEENLSKEFIPLAVAESTSKNQVIPCLEAFIHKSLPIAGVQYHPERMNCEFAKNIINTLIN